MHPRMASSGLKHVCKLGMTLAPRNILALFLGVITNTEFSAGSDERRRRLLKLFQHLEKFQQHRVRGWHLPGPLLPPSEHHVPVPRANLLGASSAGASPSPLPHLPPIPGEGRMGGKRDRVSLNNSMPSLCRPVLSEVQPHVVPGPIRFS